MSLKRFLNAITGNTKRQALKDDLANMTPEYRVMTEVLMDYIKDRTRSSYHASIFKLVILIYLFIVTIMVIAGMNRQEVDDSADHVALVSLNGQIAANTDASANMLVSGIRAAMKSDKAKAVIVAANSPGGSPVQSDYVNDEILRLREEYPDKPVYFVVSDLCASGCYYMAAAADAIYVNESSIVGSIGVVMNGFGFTGAMEKLGVERRMLTAGESKGMLDPFSPLSETEVLHAQSMLNDIHQQFIAVVKEGRGDKLADDPDLFTGKIWSGRQAVELGLADGFYSVGQLAREKYDTENIVDYSVRQSRLNDVIKKLSASVSPSGVISTEQSAAIGFVMPLFESLGENPSGKDVVIGDLHGMVHVLWELLERIDFDPVVDRLIACGDLADRGPYSLEAMSLVEKDWFYSVQGNHDQLFHQYVLDKDERAEIMLKKYGGKWAVSSKRKHLKALAERVRALPVALEFTRNGARFGVCHAELPFGVTHWAELRERLLTGEMTERQIQTMLWGPADITNLSAKPIQGADLIFHGHTIVTAPSQRGKQVFLDTGAYKDQMQTSLTAAVLDGSGIRFVSQQSFSHKASKHADSSKAKGLHVNEY